MIYNDLCQSFPKFTVYTPFFLQEEQAPLKKIVVHHPVFTIKSTKLGRLPESWGSCRRLCCHTNRAGVQMALSSVITRVHGARPVERCYDPTDGLKKNGCMIQQ